MFRDARENAEFVRPVQYLCMGPVPNTLECSLWVLCAVLGSMSVPVPGMKIPAVPRHQAVVERHFDDPATAADNVRASRINAVAATHVARHR